MTETQAHIVLLRAIGGATHAKMTMKQLEAKLQAIGFTQTRSILATGNFVVRSSEPAIIISKFFEDFLAAAQIRSVVFLRTHRQFRDLIAANPFPEAAQIRPSQFSVSFTESLPSDESISALLVRCHGERIARIGDELAMDFNGKISDSKLTPVFIDKTLGCASTARNWNTVLKLLEASA